MLVAAVLVSLFTTGCIPGGSNNVEVEVRSVQDQARSKDGLDPLTRGKIRQQILSDTKENIGIWLKGDTKNLEKAFTKDFLPEYMTRINKLHAEGKDKVRMHENQEFEVTGLAENTAMVKYTFYDKSHFVSTETKRVVKKLNNPKSEITITVKKQGERWKIKRLIGSGDGTL